MQSCGSNFWVCGQNLKVRPFKWRLFDSTFTKYNLFHSVFNKTIYCWFDFGLFGSEKVNRQLCKTYISPHKRVGYCDSNRRIKSHVHSIPGSFRTRTKTIPDRPGFSSHIREVISAQFLQRSETAPCPSLKWRVTYRIGVHCVPGSF